MGFFLFVFIVIAFPEIVETPGACRRAPLGGCAMCEGRENGLVIALAGLAGGQFFHNLSVTFFSQLIEKHRNHSQNHDTGID